MCGGRAGSAAGAATAARIGRAARAAGDAPPGTNGAAGARAPPAPCKRAAGAASRSPAKRLAYALFFGARLAYRKINGHFVLSSLRGVPGLARLFIPSPRGDTAR